MRPPAERPEEFDRLVETARAELRRRTESESHDPGRSLLELFAYVGDLLSYYAEQVANESYLVSAREDGATVIEFGDGEHGRRPPGGGGLRLSYRRERGLRSVELQEGRVVLDPDWPASTGQKACGLHRAHVMEAADPMGRGRLRVQIPTLFGSESRWAMPCFSPGTPAELQLPSAGETVWVSFEACELDYPVWLGRLSP